MVKKILLGVLAVVVIIQFIRPDRNDSNDNTHHISTKYEVPEEVAGILKVACNDCHSNMTKYPWYTNIQPVGWWLNDHIEHGTSHLNFSEFTNRRVAIQNHKLEEIIFPIGNDFFHVNSDAKHKAWSLQKTEILK